MTSFHSQVLIIKASHLISVSKYDKRNLWKLDAAGSSASSLPRSGSLRCQATWNWQPMRSWSRMKLGSLCPLKGRLGLGLVSCCRPISSWLALALVFRSIWLPHCVVCFHRNFPLILFYWLALLAASFWAPASLLKCRCVLNTNQPSAPFLSDTSACLRRLLSILLSRWTWLFVEGCAAWTRWGYWGRGDCGRTLKGYENGKDAEADSCRDGILSKCYDCSIRALEWLLVVQQTTWSLLSHSFDCESDDSEILNGLLISSWLADELMAEIAVSQELYYCLI